MIYVQTGNLRFFCSICPYVIDVNESIQVYDKLKNIDSKNIELKIIENDNHFLTSHAFKDKYLYEWLEKNI